MPRVVIKRLIDQVDQALCVWGGPACDSVVAQAETNFPEILSELEENEDVDAEERLKLCIRIAEHLSKSPWIQGDAQEAIGAQSIETVAAACRRAARDCLEEADNVGDENPQLDKFAKELDAVRRRVRKTFPEQGGAFDTAIDRLQQRDPEYGSEDSD